MISKEELMGMTAEQIYSQVNKHMTTALMFHFSMANYFNFIGLHGFKRKHEYQYFDESIGRAKLHKKVMDLHNKLIPIEGHGKIDVIPDDWYRYTRMDINDSVLSKFVKNALMKYKDWEEQTKQFYEDVCHVFAEKGMYSDFNIMNCYTEWVQCELKEIYRTCEELNNVGYDVLYIMDMQKGLHKEYKEKMKHLKA